jgi:predicted trehalose synthase
VNFDPDQLAELASRYLERQSWFLQSTSADRGPLLAESVDELVEGSPGLYRLVFMKGTSRLQLFAGIRSSSTLVGALRNEEAALFGPIEVAGETHLAYDALADDECCRRLLEVATTGHEHANRVRPVASLLSHTSLVFDERLFMKCYRVLEAGERAESSVLFGLDSVEFNAIISPVARWSDRGVDLALIREFLPSALEGRLLALTSLRDLLAYVNETEDEQGFRPVAAGSSADQVAASAGGDIAFEMRRLGQTAARLHVALAEAFGDVTFVPRGELLVSSLDTGTWPAQAWGREIRLHGDFHLRRVMRTDGGWIISGFGDDPIFAMTTAAGSVVASSGSPLEDVADMFFALRRVADEALRLRSSAEQPYAAPLAHAWTRRNQQSFLRGYLEVDQITRLLPTEVAIREWLLARHLALRAELYAPAN